MGKNIFISIIFLGILGYILLFSGINTAFAVSCGVSATDCPAYCASRCDDLGNGLNPPEGTLCICNPWTATSTQGLINNVTNFIFLLATAVVPLLFMIAGFYFITAGGNPANIEKAKKIIIYTIIGYAIVLFSRALTSLLNNILGK